MINKAKLNEYMNSTPKGEALDAEAIAKNAHELLQTVKKLKNEIDSLIEEENLQDEIKEEGIPEDLGLAILKIKADAEAGNDRAIEALSKIQTAFNV